MDYQKALESNIWKFYLWGFFGFLVFSIPILVLFWQENGLSLTQIMILQSLYSIAIIIFEVPSGIFADVFGKKNSLLFSVIFFIISSYIYYLGHNFSQFLIAEIFWALSLAFLSGADSAFIFDTLKDLKKENLYKKVWGNYLFITTIAMSFACIVGGFLGEINLRMVLLINIPVFILLIPITLSMREPMKHKRIIDKNYFQEMFQAIKISFVENKKLKWLIIYATFLYAFNFASFWFYQPYFRLTGLNIAYFGIIFAAFYIISGLTSKYAHFLEKKIGESYSLILLLMLTASCYFLMSNFVFLFSFSFVFLLQFARGYSNVIFSDYVNKLVESKIRATTLSFLSMFENFVYALIIPFFGWFADVYGLREVFLVLGITTFFIGAFLLLMMRKAELI